MMNESELSEQNNEANEVMRSPEEEVRALYGHIFGARQKNFTHNFYLIYIVGVKSLKSARNVLMRRYTVSVENLSQKGACVSKYFTSEELLNELSTFSVVDLGEYVALNDTALADAATKFSTHFKI